MLSPTSTTNNQTNENERRKKYTIERTKANHLSRQLQMRLQYARLKVDHGWQKQNLNEVENLYFHHTHQRGTKSYPLPSLVATTQNDMPSFTNSRTSPPQSSLSFKVGSSTLSRNHVNLPFASNIQEGTTDSTSYIGLSPHPPISELPSSSAESHISYPAKISTMDIYRDGKGSPTPSSHSRALPFSSPRTVSPYLNSQSGQHYLTSNASGSTDASRMSNSPTPGRGFSSASATAHSSSSTDYHSDVAPAQLRSRHGAYNVGPYPSPSSSTLTYDSFWSSRSFRGSTGSVLASVHVADGSSSHFVDSDAVGHSGQDSGMKKKNGNEGCEEEKGLIGVQEC